MRRKNLGIRDGLGAPRPHTTVNPRLTALCAATLVTACVAPTEELERPEFLLAAPASVDLGWITTDEPVEGRFDVENVGEVSVVLEGVRVIDGADVRIEDRLDGALLHPGASMEVVIDVEANRSVGDRIAVPFTFEIAGVAPDDARLPIVELRARVSHSGLVAEPNPVTIGPVLYLETQTGTVAIRNLRSTPIDVFALRHAQGRAQYEEAVTRGAFGPLPEVDGGGRIITLAPHDAETFEIDYTSPGGPGEAKEQAVWRVGSCVGDDTCALDIVVQGLPDHDAPSVHLAPGGGVHFGPISVGATVEAELRITNNGRRALDLANARFVGSPEFEAVLFADTKIAPGAELFATFRYTPADVSLDNGELLFETNDPLNRTASVRVTGSGVVLPPCRLDVRPTTIDFGNVDVFATRTMGVVVTSIGTDACVAFDPRIHLAAGVEPLTFYFERAPPTSVTLQPNDVVSYIVTYAPTRPGRHFGALVVRTGPTDSVEIPLRGATPDGQVLSCTPNRTVDLGETVGLSAAIAAGTNASAFAWRIRSGPMNNGAIAADLRPDGPGAEFVPHAVGSYVVEVEVTTTTGTSHTCQTEIEARSTGFAATLTWDGAGDLDLHVHRGASAPWFGPADCHFDNLQPTWDATFPPGAGPNASLDGDDTSGDGPENIRIQTPEIGVPYTIAVGHFERAQRRRARVQVFCGRATSQIDLTSRPFTGDATGACTANDFWTVATVTFTAEAQCVVQTIDAYRTTDEACVAF